MRDIRFYPKGLVPLKGRAGTVVRLARLRASLEKDAASLSDLTVPAVLLLYDVCKALGLSNTDLLRVLGRRGSQFMSGWLGTKVRPNGTPIQHRQMRRR